MNSKQQHSIYALEQQDETINIVTELTCEQEFIKQEIENGIREMLYRERGQHFDHNYL